MENQPTCFYAVTRNGVIVRWNFRSRRRMGQLWARLNSRWPNAGFQLELVWVPA